MNFKGFYLLLVLVLVLVLGDLSVLQGCLPFRRWALVDALQFPIFFLVFSVPPCETLPPSVGPVVFSHTKTRCR